MAVTEQDFRQRMLEKAKAVAPKRTINESYLRQAAVSSELLTNHPAWDLYLQKLQVLMEEAVAGLESWVQKLPGAYSDADLRKAQIEINVFTDRIATLTHCMTLPKEILAHAKEVSSDHGG